VPPAPKGELRRASDGRHTVRLRFGGTRVEIDLGVVPRDRAEQRAATLALVAKRVGASPQKDKALDLLRMAGPADARRWAACLAALEDLAQGRLFEKSSPVVETVAAFGARWTSGLLHDEYPDHVPRKASSHKDEQYLRRYVYPVIGHLPVAAVTLDHADEVMARVPRHLSAATRRHVAQALRRLLGLAAYPAKLRAANPLPRGWLPGLGAEKAKDALYPDEEAILLGCLDVPITSRLAYGLMCREGFRKSEVARLEWRDLDLTRGFVRLDKNKTDDPRTWDLATDTCNALRTYREVFGGAEGDRVLARLGTSHMGSRLREDLQLAGIQRPELFERSATRIPLRAHDLRATFVTIALAAGRSETWISDRTGHKSSAMIRTYARQARRYASRDLVALAPLGLAIPELRLPQDCPIANDGDFSRTTAKPKTRRPNRKDRGVSDRFLISRSQVRSLLGTQNAARCESEGAADRPKSPRFAGDGANDGANDGALVAA
jgi:integrase